MRTKLRQRRAELGLTQEEVAKRAGLSRSSYANIEGSARAPSFKAVVAIKRAIGYDGDDIFFDDDCLETRQEQ